MTLLDLRDRLLETGLPVYHYFTHAEADKYIIWAEDSEGNSGHADNRKTTQILQGTIDYFTKTEYDSNFDLIQEKLNTSDIAWKLNSVQHEEETGFIHYEWLWEMI
ncbi:hypothetical protein [Anaerotalea alkaliphila]|uniref:Uncharacterized protein n=1 Tax=Anaerotalea alkaliphila TaxID=2662126 RepID=A0A7X5KP83_9FIRM|nr:hypothetical protein [Anaerotalea alkaliphila]NDL68849.1 hypothetical protein [Anaerotalea alkaliphila]